MANTKLEEAFELVLGKDRDTGLPQWQTIRKDGKLHSPSDDQPAQIVYDKAGNTIERGWFRENFYHRETGPSLQRINPENGVVEYEEHRQFGRMHRANNQPAQITRNPQTGNILEARYFVNGREIEPQNRLTLDPSL